VQIGISKGYKNNNLNYARKQQKLTSMWKKLGVDILERIFMNDSFRALSLRMQKASEERRRRDTKFFN
jgi:hypothetical protein